MMQRGVSLGLGNKVRSQAERVGCGNSLTRADRWRWNAAPGPEHDEKRVWSC